jgi:hypothetical protein
MDIRFISSLTLDDENRVAPALLAAMVSVLDHLPIAYTLRLETSSGRSFHHGHSPEDRTGLPEAGPDIVDLPPRPVG